MASLMDDIMKRYYGGLGPFTPLPQGGESLRQAGAGILAGQVGQQSPTTRQSPYGTLAPFTPMPQGGAGLGQMPADAAIMRSAADVGLPTSNIPMPPSRPALPGRTPGFLDQLLSGPNYQSNNMPVDVRAQGPSMPGQEMPIQAINYGDPNSASDFFRADQLMMQNPNIPGFLGGY